MNLIEVLKNKNRDNLNKTAIYFYEKFFLLKEITYQNLFDKIDQKASMIKAQNISGFALICIANPLDFLISFLALVQAGCVPVPFAPVNTGLLNHFKDRANHLFLNYKFDFIVTDNISFDELTIYSDYIVNLDFKFKNNIFKKSTPDIHANACFVQFSSGSTSNPKGVVINNKQLIANLEQINQALNPSATDKIITWLPLYHDMGLIGAIFSPLFAQAEVHLMATQDYIGQVEKYLDLICEKKINFVLGPDFMYRQMSKILNRKKFNLSHLKVCMSGAELVLPSTTRLFKNALKHSDCFHDVFRPVYGMAEACLAVAFQPAGQPPQIHTDKNNREVVSCGEALEQQFIKVINSENESVNQGEIGEVAVAGRSIFEEYYLNKVVKSITPDGFFKTGDEGYIINQQIYLLGRKKDVIIFNGVKYHSLDIENLIFENHKNQIGRIACVQLDGFYVVAEIPWHLWIFKLRIKNKINNTVLQKSQLKPKGIILVPKFDLPRTTSGKIQRYKVIEKLETREYFHPIYFLKSIFLTLKGLRGIAV